jgi:ABC-type branched-subunit amino acid transport system substrate-binding protein
MTRNTPSIRPLAAAFVGACLLLAAGCSGGASDATTSTALPEATSSTTSTTSDGASTLDPVEGIGVDPVSRTISLGVLADLSGPFASLSIDVTDALEVYWDGVNAAGGIQGWTVDLVIADTRGDPAQWRDAYEELEPRVLAIAQAFGSQNNAEILDAYRSDTMLVVPLSWYSGWPFEEVDGGLVLEQYTNYCIEAMNAVDFAVDNGAASLAIATDADVYGRDAGAGASFASNFYALPVAYDGTGEIQAGGELSVIVRSIADSGADWTFLATSPSTSAQIIAGAVQLGYQGVFIGAAPSYDPRLLDSASAELFSSRFFQSAYVAPWGTDVPGIREMMGAMATVYPDRRPSDAFIVGWNAGVTMRSVLSAAIGANDLTRRGMLRAANGIETVSFGGSAPDQRYAGEPADFVTRASAVYKPDLDAYEAAGGFDQRLTDPNATTGSILVRDFTTGEAATLFDFAAPCHPIDEGPDG